MKIVIFGATGMVGQGALRESLRDPGVQSVLSIVRTASGRQQQKLREITHQDFLDFTSLENELQGLDACLFCLGVSSAGMAEAAYARELRIHDRRGKDAVAAESRNIICICLRRRHG